MRRTPNSAVRVPFCDFSAVSTASPWRRRSFRGAATTLGAALLILATRPQSVCGDEAALVDPFNPAASASEAPAGGASSVNPFRARVAPEAASATTDGGTTPHVARPGGQSRRELADQALLDARRALSVGDLPRAQQFLAQAEELEVAYEGAGDSPQNVAESIRQGQELAELRSSPGGATAWRQMYSRFLVEQAEALLSWNDLERATIAATEAGQLNPRYPVGGVTPRDVLRRIAERREGIGPNPAAAAAAGTTLSIADAKAQTLQLLGQARAALAAGDLAQAQALAGQASALDVPDSQFAPYEDRPSRLAADLLRAGAESDGGAELVDAALPTTTTPSADDYAQAIAETDGATLELAQVPAEAPLPLPGSEAATPLTVGDAAAPSEALELVEAGEAALRARDIPGALERFRAAYELREQLDVLTQQRLQGHLQMLSVESAAADPSEALPLPDGELLDSAAEGQSLAARQLSAEVSEHQSQAARVLEQDPNQSLSILREARELVESSSLDEGLQRQLLSRIDHSLSETQKYIEAHRAELELDAENQEILDQIEREQAVRSELQNRIAEMVDQFNTLVDEHRYAEAEVVANRLYAMAPDDMVAQQINKQAKMIRREAWLGEISAESEEGVATVKLDILQTSAQALAGATRNFEYDVEYWRDIENREASSEFNSRRTIKTIEIEQKLDTPVLPRFDETPLSKVMETLSQFAGINIHLDPRGLEQEGQRSDTPVTLNLPQEISLKSALTLILEPLHLTYTIKDEVLKITSEDIRDGDIERRVYPVGDLVVPIPNFVPSNNMGLQGLINDAYAAMGGAGYGAPGPMAMVGGARAESGQVAGQLPSNTLGQQFGAAGQPTGGGGAMGGGPGGLGGAANADFDSLIDLIVSTVEHDSWMENGTGEGEIQPFPTNLSLVISQTQRVHEQIADLLEQLRRLQDLQVTIEVRFIRLTDSFFERIGVDFDFNIEDGSGLSTNPLTPNSLFPGAVYEPRRSSASVGIQAPTGLADFPNYTVDLDMPFRQDAFGLTLPQFATPQPVGSFGFAILSDIEAFFLIEASQGDRRANVLQAPKVTLFNGQSAVVVDSAFVPFVISVIPVVGDFAAAQQPVIVVLSEGTLMTVQAVVSDDRRYVRLTLVPFFSSIGEVREFTFEGSTTTSSSSASVDDDEDGTDEESEDAEEITRSGTTVQLPTFEIISVSTTVSVPDGGTVLLGGIKRLREGRNEFGVPLLSKVPYVDRLFRNVGIGRETDSLMMMVTPHIIIQEEEEERLGVATE
jgi:general secretion pathway protein D